MSGPLRVPVQGSGNAHLPARHPARAPDAHPPGTISWAEHLEAYATYARRNGGYQSAERLAERGGFAFGELTELLGHEPRTWEPR